MKSKVCDVNVGRRQRRFSIPFTLLLRFVATISQLKCEDVHLCAVVAIKIITGFRGKPLLIYDLIVLEERNPKGWVMPTIKAGV